MTKLISKKLLLKKYNFMLKEVGEEKVAPGRFNNYLCLNKSCNNIMKTIDVDKGVTPGMTRCDKCQEMARSCMYSDMIPLKPATIQWYRPGFDELFNKRDNLFLVDHVLLGGLIDKVYLTL